MEPETIALLRGQSILYSYICLGNVDCVRTGSQAIALACLRFSMLSWQWFDIASQFIDLMSADVDSFDMEDILLCESYLTEEVQKAMHSEKGEKKTEDIS